jgi:hypothetical protein
MVRDGMTMNLKLITLCCIKNVLHTIVSSKTPSGEELDMSYMRSITLSLFFLFLTSIPALSTPDKRPISIILPDTLIKEIIQKTLPMDVPIQSKTILGSVSIDAIKNITLHKNKLSGHVTLSGHELNIVTTIAGHKLRMKIGSLTMGFQCDATIRFDAKNQTLYVKPVITELQSSDKAKTEVASLIAQLFNNREFPLQLDKIKPISADSGDKVLHIAMRVDGVSVHPGEIHLQATPQITDSQRENT